jgi:hypothetical protein
MLINQPEAALKAVESHFGSETRRYIAKTFLRYKPVWNPLRGNPRFEVLLKVPEQKKQLARLPALYRRPPACRRFSVGPRLPALCRRPPLAGALP